MRDVILMPTYNESANIVSMLQTIFSLHPDISIMVIDDNSPDGTAGLVRGLQSTYPNLTLLSRPAKDGLGRAYVHGFSEVLKFPDVGKIIIMDADFSHDPEYLAHLLMASDEHDVAIGSRYIPSGSTVGWEPWRKSLSTAGNIYCRTILGLDIHDYTAGFVAMNAAKLREVDLGKLNVSGYAFQIALKYLLSRAGARFKEIPIEFKNRRGGESKLTGHIIFEGIIIPWKIKFQT